MINRVLINIDIIFTVKLLEYFPIYNIYFSYPKSIQYWTLARVHHEYIMYGALPGEIYGPFSSDQPIHYTYIKNV